MLMPELLAIVRAFYAAVARGDIQEVVGLLHPQLEWSEAEGFPYFGGTWRTPKDVVEKLLVPLARDWDNFSATPADFIIDGYCIVSLGTTPRERADGQTEHCR